MRLNRTHALCRLISVALLALLCASAWAQSSPPLSELRFDLVGIRLEVDPPVLTVPRNIATQINTKLAAPEGSGPETQAALAKLRNEGTVVAELRGPSIPPVTLRTRPGEPIPLPPFALAGDYFLDNIRLESGGQTLLQGSPNVVPIAVISEILVTSVSTRPLTLEEIREKGLVIDQSSFQAVNFQLAFNIDGAKFTIDLPTALPTRELLALKPEPKKLQQDLQALNLQLNRDPVMLPPEFDRPGLNFSIAALPFVPRKLDDDEGDSFGPPPITGLLVIPGNIQFLNQFFSVMLTVGNVAPDGTPLVLTNVTGEIFLPTGRDMVAGTAEAPGDDPLRLARIEGIGTVPVIDVVQPGPDGEVGTPDDIPQIPPQVSGQGEFLVEGLKEGFHSLDIDINAVLEGLPSGPVEVTGSAIGAVLVTNPKFSITLSHPRTVRSGEQYDLFATVTNTSQLPANLVSVNLSSLSISGAQLISDETVGFETLEAGEAKTAKFTLIAQQTGDVTFSSLTTDDGLSGQFLLRTGIGERGIPLSPNAIVLPRTTDFLPAGLIAAAQRVLGQAYSISTAPAGALPPEVTFVPRSVVIRRGQQLGEAGQRVQFGESIARVMADLMLDWLGSGSPDPGFDQLLRETDAGRAFIHELSLVIQQNASGQALIDWHHEVGLVLVNRPDHLSAATGLEDGPASVTLHLIDPDGNAVGLEDGSLVKDVAYANLLTLLDAAGMRELAVASRPSTGTWTIEVTATDDGPFDLSILVPTAPDTLTQVSFPAVDVTRDSIARIEIDLYGLSNAFQMQLDLEGDGSIDEVIAPQLTPIVEGPPEVLNLLQLETSFGASPGDLRDPAAHGLLIGALYDKPVTESSTEAVDNYEVEANTVLGAQLQQSGRLVYLYLERPIGNLVERDITIRDIADGAGRLLAETTRTIVTVLDDGARVFGQVRNADGTPVANAIFQLTVVFGQAGFTVVSIETRADGTFDLDYVTALGDRIVLYAQRPTDLRTTELIAKIRAPGQQLLLNPTFFGLGSIRGVVLAEDGVTPVPGAVAQFVPSGGDIDLRREKRQLIANEVGEFVFTDVPVGPYTIRARDAAGAFGIVSGVIETAGQSAETNVVLVNTQDEAGRLTGRVFLSDGITPAVGFTVYVGDYDPVRATIGSIDQTTTDEAGVFEFESVPAQSWDIVAVDFATGQIGSTPNVAVLPRTTSSANVIMDALGAVEGVVFNAQGQPVPGALIAGGLELGEADENGFFRIEGVPAGKRTIQAGDPVTKRRGQAEVTVLPGDTVNISITLEARATIVGQVTDAAGNPVPRVTVRLPSADGYTFVFSDLQGFFRFPDLHLGDHLIQAPGPPWESLVEYMKFIGTDPRAAFTSGDIPPSLGGDAAPIGGDVNAALDAYAEAVSMFVTGVNPALLGFPPPPAGGFGWNKVQLFQDSATYVADVEYLPQGTVSGTTVDANDLPTGALVRVKSIIPDDVGFATFKELARLNTDPATGEFSFGGIARFDLLTFQAAGVDAGRFTLEAANPFSPTIVSHSNKLTPNNPNLDEIVLKFPGAAVTNGTITGRVFMPDGVTPAPGGVEVNISFGDLQVRTDTEGRFENLFPIPAGSYAITAVDPATGLRGQTYARIPAGGNVDVELRLLGLGNVDIAVVRPGGSRVTDAEVRLKRLGFPGDQADGFVDGEGKLRFVNITEGPFSVTVTEQGTGLKGLANGMIVRGGDTAVTVTLTASGTVMGKFLSAEGNEPIANAQIALTGAGGVRAYAATDAEGRFDLFAIPVGNFTVDAFDPVTRRTGRTTGRIDFEGQWVSIIVRPVPRGRLSGFVFNSDGATAIPGATVCLDGGSPASTSDLQVTSDGDGFFDFQGVSAGPFKLLARDPVSGFRGTAMGQLSYEGEEVFKNVILAPFGGIKVTVYDDDGTTASNVELSLTHAQRLTPPRSAAVDLDGMFTFEHLNLGDYRIIARSLSETNDAGYIDLALTEANETVEAEIHLRGTGTVNIRVVEADGTTNVPSGARHVARHGQPARRDGAALRRNHGRLYRRQWRSHTPQRPGRCVPRHGRIRTAGGCRQ